MTQNLLYEFILSLNEKEAIAFLNAMLWQLLEEIGWVKKNEDYSEFEITQKGVERISKILKKLSKDALMRLHKIIKIAPNNQKRDEYLLICIIHEKFINLGWIEPSQDTFHTRFTNKGSSRLIRVAKKISRESFEKVIRTMQEFHL